MLLNVTNKMVHLLRYGIAFHLIASPISMLPRMGHRRAYAIDVYVRAFASAVGDNFVLMDDNARPHRARILE